VPGLWKGDLIEEPRNSCFATLVDRHSHHLMLCKLDKKDTESVVSPLIKKSMRLPRELYTSLIRDSGTELDEQRMAQPSPLLRVNIFDVCGSATLGDVFDIAMPAARTGTCLTLRNSPALVTDADPAGDSVHG
jgi:hypothetical protein